MAAGGQLLYMNRSNSMKSLQAGQNGVAANYYMIRGAGGNGGVLPYSWITVLCIASFCLGLLFTNRIWLLPQANDAMINDINSHAVDCENSKHISASGQFPSMPQLEESSKRHQAAVGSTSDSTEAEMEAWKASSQKEISSSTDALSQSPSEMINNNDKLQAGSNEISTSASSSSSKAAISSGDGRPKVFMVVGINTAFSSRKRRDSIRQTWMPKGDKLRKLEEEKGIVVRFVIGHGATPGGILDRAIAAEDLQNHDFMRLEHIEGYHELSAKTKIYFATAVSMWDAEYYIKVDDDVHVNLGALGANLAQHRGEPRLYIGCMKSGPVLAQKGVRYHEPEHWKFGEYGNQYFRHATGQLYAISRDLAVYISQNKEILHRYANEDVSLGAWFIGLDVNHVDDRKMCCGTHPDCEWKLQAGNACVASFDWTCSGVCNSVDRMKSVHQKCGEGDKALWNAVL